MASAQADVHTAGNNISVGEEEPYCCRSRATVVGTIRKQAVFITTNLTIVLLAVVVLLRLFNLLIASRPNGVAALSSPSIFAVIFIAIVSRTFSSFNSGNINFNKGESSLHSFFVRPLFSAI